MAANEIGLISTLQALGLLVLVPAVAGLSSSPLGAWATLSELSTVSDPIAPLLAVLTLAAWACSGWLLLVAATTWGGRLPGVAGRAARRTSERVAPASVRALVRVALGATVAASALGAPGAAFADQRPPAGSYDWPGTTVDATRPTTVAAQPTARPAPHTALPGREAVPSSLVVQPGDSLWAIAARHLGSQVSDAQVARAWPRWWAANRAVVGDDPDLIQPGARLVPPARNQTRPHSGDLP
ncbi:MAG: hypothetical protein JWM02_811 [Frankiales bacterium]|nr:hypothetical protein [Frankiales bacterium]